MESISSGPTNNGSAQLSSLLTSIVDSLHSDNAQFQTEAKTQQVSSASATSADMDNNRSGESKYKRLKKIGVGSYGVVFKCENRRTGKIVAIKRYSENDTDASIRKIAMREVRMLRQLKHPNLINLIEVFRRKHRLHLVFDYCELTLLDVIERYGRECPLTLIRKVIWQLVNGTKYCHDHNCIHRDIKPENILVTASGIVKICDFGFARTINQSESSLTVRANKENANMAVASKDASPGRHSPEIVRQALTEYVATRWYRAPELLIGNAFYDYKIDIWAIGCVAAELMRGEPLLPGKTDADQLLLIMSSLGPLTQQQAETLITTNAYDNATTDHLLAQMQASSLTSTGDSLNIMLPMSKVGDTGLSFVASCLHIDPSDRPTCRALLTQPFISVARMPQMNVAPNTSDARSTTYKRQSPNALASTGDVKRNVDTKLKQDQPVVKTQTSQKRKTNPVLQGYVSPKFGTNQQQRSTVAGSKRTRLPIVDAGKARTVNNTMSEPTKDRKSSSSGRQDKHIDSNAGLQGDPQAHMRGNDRSAVAASDQIGERSAHKSENQPPTIDDSFSSRPKKSSASIESRNEQVVVTQMRTVHRESIPITSNSGKLLMLSSRRHPRKMPSKQATVEKN